MYQYYQNITTLFFVDESLPALGQATFILVLSILLSEFFNAEVRRGNAEDLVEIDQICEAIIKSGIYVYSILRPRLLEEPYKQCKGPS
jgi:hypothetical protein